MHGNFPFDILTSFFGAFTGAVCCCEKPVGQNIEEILMSGMYDPPHPGTILAETLEHLGLNARQFARHLDVTPAAVTRVMKGEGPVTPELAVRIAHVLPGPSAAMWLRLQYCHDVWQAEHMLAISRLRPLTLSEEEKAEAVRTPLPPSGVLQGLRGPNSGGKHSLSEARHELRAQSAPLLYV